MKTTILGVLTIIGGVAGAGIAFLSGKLDASAIAACTAASTAGVGPFGSAADQTRNKWTHFSESHQS
jgi:hypothetical protein